jgi:NAD(P)-dependent dehydrogenase (short-subunit alcohol dehydrogenase family)
MNNAAQTHLRATVPSVSAARNRPNKEGMMLAERTNGKVVLVTGAGSGLGKATAEAFRQAGFRVAALDLKSDGIADFPSTDAFACDVSDAGAVERAISDIIDRSGRIDVAVNCAGVDHTYWIEELTVEQFDRVIGVNLRGPFLVAKAVWPVMKANGGGHIVNIASTAALRTWSGASAYHASKFGVLGLGRALHIEGRPDNIRVITIIPGGMNTGFFERFAAQGIPLPDPSTLQDPADVASAIVYAVGLPAGSVMQEMVLTPPNEPSWP